MEGELLIIDSTGLGYTLRGKPIHVHYPRRNEAGETVYSGAGLTISEIPEWYFTDPPNEITRERVEIWRDLFAAEMVESLRKRRKV